MTNALQQVNKDEIATMDDIGKLAVVIDAAKAAEIFYAAQGATEEAQRIAEIKLRAIHRAGRILLPPGQGGLTVRQPGERTDLVKGVDEVQSQYSQMLDEAGISRQTSGTWQKVGRVKEELLEAYLAEAVDREELTIASLLKRAGSWFGRSDLDAYETPQWLFDLLDAEFHFSLDVCALPSNTKCKKFYQPSDDGLMKIWKGACWMNPPYGKTILDWMRKARESADNGATVVCLVPARTDTEWWWTSCPMSEVRFIRGRLQWPVRKETGEILAWTTAPFPSAVIVMQPGQRWKVVWWDVQSKRQPI
jgi:phage N-6-adenine-methyltransferase